MMEGLVEGELEFDGFAAEHAEFAIDDFVGFGEEGALSVFAEGLGKLGAVGEREQMSREQMTGLDSSILLYSLVMSRLQPQLIQGIQRQRGKSQLAEGFEGDIEVVKFTHLPP